MNAARKLLTAVALGLLIIAAAYGQLANSGIKGTVTDSSGAVLVQAKVEIANVATGETRETTTTSQGSYSVAALPPGEAPRLGVDYEILEA